MTAAELAKWLKAAQKANDFRNLREGMKDVIWEIEREEDNEFGKREGTEFFKTDKSFEPERNKVVKVSDVLAAANLIAAQFMVRTWPGFLKTKIEEYVLGKVVGAVAAKAAAKLSLKSIAKAISGAIGAVAGAFAVRTTQAEEMKALEKKIREGSAKWRKELNELALSQAKKPARVGPTYTRNPKYE